ncbi:MAG: four helix bundle protein [Planctomycetota bacterium]
MKAFARLPKTEESRVIGKQMLRSGTSVGAQYREARRARSDAESLSKITSAHQELEETTYWLELLVRCEIVPKSLLGDLLQEADELGAIFTSIVLRLKERLGR